MVADYDCQLVDSSQKRQMQVQQREEFKAFEERSLEEFLHPSVENV